MEQISAKLNVAILGSSHEQEGSVVWNQVQELSSWLIENTEHRIITAGANGVAKAAAQAARVITGAPEVGDPTRIDVYVDQRDGQNFFSAERKGDGIYYHNLQRLMQIPDVFVIWPGYQGTMLQLLTLLHQIRLGEIKMDHRRIFLICGKGHQMSAAAQAFYQNVADPDKGPIHFPWSRIDPMHYRTLIREGIGVLAEEIPRWVTEVFEQKGAGSGSLHDFRNSFLTERGISWRTAAQVAEALVEADRIKFSQSA